MALYSSPPPLRSFYEDKPTLLVCWWTTIFSAVIILTRVTGRFIRTERLFREDKTAALALIPLLLRMGCVHYILLHGTNNVLLDGVVLSEEDIRRREIASRLVLVSRVLYAATLWIFKITIVEFFRRLTDLTWERSYRTFLNGIYVVLGLTFAAVVISDLAECRPSFQHYWQVVPDPGPQCRQGYANLLTLATANVLTDLLLVFFPVPIILRSSMPLKRKIQLVLLFSLSLAVVATTLYRVPHTIWKHGSQQYRSLMASVELLFAAAAANTLVLGSFVRDRGVKKPKFRYGSEDLESGIDGSIRRYSEPQPPPTGISTLQRHWGSDEDLVRGLGIGVKPELRDPAEKDFPPAPAHTRRRVAGGTVDMRDWEFPRGGDGDDGGERDERSSVTLLPPTRRGSAAAGPQQHQNQQKHLSFFDVGGLLDEDNELARRAAAARRASSSVNPLQPIAPGAIRRGSAALLQDLGGFLSFSSSSASTPAAAWGRSQSISTAGPRGTAEGEPSRPPGARPGTPELQDVGGLIR
ncbi:related to integral membrane protein PTH11 [Cephalotrichum gorgonifer]|uniref:Related to integral membrane protein PTH11 n=1 Tax=Cephalotrichum gorgonifer TaxID=2041049 RepID=A0AAE8N3Y9_9PEZI|nr:related to integral membrane protein PTH11 [Cephalotrichum gorgonifer]